MNIIQRPRQTGKTTSAIYESVRTGCHIVTTKHSRKRFISDLADSLQLGSPLPEIFTYDEITDPKFGIGSGASVKGFIFDDFDEFLSTLFNITKIKSIYMFDDHT